MPTFEQRRTKKGQTRWRARVRIKGSLGMSKTFSSKAEACFWAQQTEVRLRVGSSMNIWQHRRRLTAEAIDLYMQEVVPRYGYDVQGRQLHLQWWKTHIGHIPLVSVSPAVITQCRNDLSREITVRHTLRSPATVNRYLSSLGHVFTIAIKEWGWLEQSPLQSVIKLKEPSGRTRFLSDDERRRLLDACRQSSSPDLYLAVVLALSTAARKMEIMQLRWRDVDFQTGQLMFRNTKNGECRIVPLQGYAFFLLRQRVKCSDMDLLFPGKANPDCPVSLRTAWERVLKMSGINDFRWHDLRHSSASYLAMSGATLIELSQVLGHKTLSMVKRYAHLSENHTARIVADMNQRIFKGACAGTKKGLKV